MYSLHCGENMLAQGEKLFLSDINLLFHHEQIMFSRKQPKWKVAFSLFFLLCSSDLNSMTIVVYCPQLIIIHLGKTQKTAFQFLFCALLETAGRAWVHILKQLGMSKSFLIHKFKALRGAWKVVCPWRRLIKWVRHDWEVWSPGCNHIGEDRVSINKFQIRYAAADRF